ncbi:unnamed protein product [Schistosoma guineensis]|nr:unnamed protein product [Schistosoma guineensis]
MAFTDSGFGNPQGSSSTSIFSSFGGSSCAGGFRSVSTSSKYVNGKMVRVTKVVENGTETITEEVDGQVTNRTVRQCGNGALQAMYDIRVESLSCVVKSRLAKIMCQLSIAFWRCSQLFNWIDIRHGYQTRHSGVHTLTKYHIFWNTVIKVSCLHLYDYNFSYVEQNTSDISIMHVFFTIL